MLEQEPKKIYFISSSISKAREYLNSNCSLRIISGGGARRIVPTETGKFRQEVAITKLEYKNGIKLVINKTAGKEEYCAKVPVELTGIISDLEKIADGHPI